MTEEYGGALGAVPYAFRRSESWVFRSYVLVGGLATVAVGLLMVLGLVVLFGRTAALEGGTMTLSRAFYVLVAVLVIGPLVAPMLLVARRHRRGDGDPGYDRRLAAAGYLFLLSVYAGLVASVPASLQTTPRGPHAPVVAALYALPRAAAVVVPLVGALAIVAAHYLRR